MRIYVGMAGDSMTVVVALRSPDVASAWHHAEEWRWIGTNPVSKAVAGATSSSSYMVISYKNKKNKINNEKDFIRDKRSIKTNYPFILFFFLL